MFLRMICAGMGLALMTAHWSNAQPSPADPTIEENLRPYYAHTGFNWKIDRIPHFELNFESGTEAERRIGQLREVAEHGRTAILNLLGIENYTPTIHIFFVSSIDRMNQLIGSEVIGRSRPTQHAIFCVVAPFSELSLAHELSHEIATNLWGAADHWLEEGFANYVVDNNSSLMYRQCLVLMQIKQWIPLKKLVNPDWKSSIYSPDDAYPELGGFVQFLYENYGVERFQKVWKDGSKSIKKVYGKKLSKLESEYRSAVLKLRGIEHPQINLPGRGDLLLQEEISH